MVRAEAEPLEAERLARSNEPAAFFKHAEGFFRPLEIDEQQLFEGRNRGCPAHAAGIALAVSEADHLSWLQGKASKLHVERTPKGSETSELLLGTEAEPDQIFADPQPLAGSIAIRVEDP